MTILYKIFRLIFSLFLILPSCCTSEQKEIEKELLSLMGKRIELGTTLIPFSLDSIPDNLTDSLRNKSRFKVIYYIDSINCSECEIRTMAPWHNYIKSYKNNLSVWIIFNSSDIQNIQVAMEKYNLNFTYFLDVESNFKKANPFISNNKLFNCVLTQNDTIVLIGNPIKNKDIEILYTQYITENSGI